VNGSTTQNGPIDGTFYMTKYNTPACQTALAANDPNAMTTCGYTGAYSCWQSRWLVEL
jgi:hypothetical protein